VLGGGGGAIGRGRAGELVGEGLGLAVVFEADEAGVFGAVFAGTDGAGIPDGAAEFVILAGAAGEVVAVNPADLARFSDL
jgi:hypothetical protein